MKHAWILLLCTISTATTIDDAVEWSEPVNGLRARLLVLPAKPGEAPFCRVMIEMENVSDNGGQKRIRFHPDKLKLRVVDQDGQELPSANGSYDGMSPDWEPLLLPYGGTLRFPFDLRGLGYRPEDKAIIDIGPPHVWVIPQDGAVYRLEGEFTVKKEPRDHRHKDWSGTLKLPPVEIPTGK